MFGLGDTELILILIFAFLLFGPDKLPSMGRTIGRGIKQFRQASDSVTKVVKTEVLNPLTDAAQAEAGAPKASTSGTAAEPLHQQERSTETFAERRARLAREREEREAAAAAAAAEAAIAEDTIGGFAAEGRADEMEGAGVVSDSGDATEPVEVETPASATTVASMWAIDEEPDGEPEPAAALAATGEEDATVPTA